MSLVGSLEDLGLGDILQIISLSRKSGLLLLRSEEGEGRVVFCDGLVRAGFVKGEVEDLKGLLVGGRFLEESAFDKAAAMAEAHGDPVAEVLATTSEISKERIDSLRREQVERSVFRMFGWATGEFSFEIRDEIDDRDRELLLTTGINAQFLTMEATRLGDEGGKDQDDDIQFGTVDEDFGGFDEAPDFSLEQPDEKVEIADTLAMAAVERSDEVDPSDETLDDIDLFAAGSADAGAAVPLVAEADLLELEQVVDDTEDAVEAEPSDEATGVEPEATAGPAAPAIEVAPSAAPVALGPEIDAVEVAPDPVPADLTALILIDPDLAALEWQKSVLGPICRRIHIFQRPDGGITRLRQYLRRGEEPVVLVSATVPADPHAGIDGASGLISRLRAHAPRMPIYLMCQGFGAPPSHLGDASGVLERPADHQVSNRRAWSKLEGDGERLREALLARPMPAPKAPRVAAAARPSAPAFQRGDAYADLQRLKRISERLRDPSVQGEVLSLILEFASELFARVAIFLVRDDEAVGVAQSGLSDAGGPGDADFQQIAIPAREPRWFRDVLEGGGGRQGAPQGEGDLALARLLGRSAPPSAYVAPIESGHGVVALLYADNLPSGDPIGDTTSLEIVLHEAGLAFERALLERALAEAE
jgi:hypothetical protein